MGEPDSEGVIKDENVFEYFIQSGQVTVKIMLNRPLGKTGKISFSGTSTLFSQECSGIQNLLAGLSHRTLGLCRDD